MKKNDIAAVSMRGNDGGEVNVKCCDYLSDIDNERLGGRAIPYLRDLRGSLASGFDCSSISVFVAVRILEEEAVVVRSDVLEADVLRVDAALRVEELDAPVSRDRAQTRAVLRHAERHRRGSAAVAARAK